MQLPLGLRKSALGARGIMYYDGLLGCCEVKKVLSVDSNTMQLHG
ncbi:hypothetical protein [Rubritalea tangerina]